MTADLHTPVQYLKGVGLRLARALARLHISTIQDLLLHAPSRYIDCRQIDATGRVACGPHRVVMGTVVSHSARPLGRNARRRIYEVIVDDGSGPLALVWFHFRQSYLEQLCPVGATLLLTGDVTPFGHFRQMTHPEIEPVDAGGDGSAARIVPVYPSTEGVSQRMLRRMIRQAWELVGDQFERTLPDWCVRHAVVADGDPTPLPRAQAVQMLHFPAPDADIEALNARRSPAHCALIFEEVFFLELGLALRRALAKKEAGVAVIWDERAHTALQQALPFVLTDAQTRVLREIAADVATGAPMRRLVQGDVGSGKTVVAAALAVQMIRAGFQVALMAPTELLAEQHARTVLPWLTALGIRGALLTGATKGKARTAVLHQLAGGDLPFVVGTHALIEAGVAFHRLGLCIIDEQHRFGVEQRFQLRRKSEATPHMLVMTATPIPRTLAMTLCGDLDVSVIDALPPGRKPVITRLYTERLRHRLYAGMRKEIAAGRQAYVVYPLVAESEKVDLKNATAMAASLAAEFGPEVRVALLHGQMPADEKDRVMRAFGTGAMHVLATTSVVEVGVDVPNATVMVIEHAERFGLAQLHQLRGRVGRGAAQSYCILMANTHGTPEARQRLAVMIDTTDGFRIAEEDLKIRGPGELLGTRQAGLPELKMARLIEDAPIIAQAREVAAALLARDPLLAQTPALRHALYAHWGDRLPLALVG